MSRPRLRLGIAGCGWAGRRHREAAAAVEGVAVTAVADADAEARAERAAEWGVDTYEGYGALVAEADLDAVVVALPHHLHEDAAARAARAGIDVLCEKPIARTVAEADRMLDAAAEAGVRLVVAESARYDPWTRAVEDLLADGDVGEPVFARYNWLHAFGGYGYERADWLNDPERLGGGQWHLNGVHLVSPLRGWSGPAPPATSNGCSPASTAPPASTPRTASRGTSAPRWRSRGAGPRP
jgi:predicted dehydrogenase